MGPLDHGWDWPGLVRLVGFVDLAAGFVAAAVSSSFSTAWEGVIFMLAVLSPLVQALSDAFGDVGTEALVIVPIAVAGGLALWGFPTLIRFGKRIFGASK